MKHHPAAFINAIAEEGTKDEAIKYLQETWSELCEAKAEILRLKTRLEGGTSYDWPGSDAGTFPKNRDD